MIFELCDLFARLPVNPGTDRDGRKFISMKVFVELAPCGVPGDLPLQQSFPVITSSIKVLNSYGACK